MTLEDYSIFIVEDEEDVRLAYQQTLELEGFNVESFSRAEYALDKIDAEWKGIVLTDIRMPGIGGLELFSAIQEIDKDIPIILITAHGDISLAVQSMRDGAYDFIEKPAEPNYLIEVVKRSLEKRHLVLDLRKLRSVLHQEKDSEYQIIGQSAKIIKLRETVAMLASTDVDVLVNGDTGTGKELVARNLHNLGNRRKENFVAVNCGGLPENIIESELFGHVKGAFTGADQNRVGKIQLAHKGTLFLDEIESMPIHLQTKLLRVIQERKVERLGSNELVDIDMRIIAAVKGNLLDRCNEGSFREDLYYRLNVASIELPTLSERSDDIPVLFNYFVKLLALHHSQDIVQVSDKLMAKLVTREWRGNIRELRNIAERYVLGLPLGITNEGSKAEHNLETTSLEARLSEYEKSIICDTLDLNNGRVGITADKLQIPRKTLYLRMRKYGIDKENYQ